MRTSSPGTAGAIPLAARAACATPTPCSVSARNNRAAALIRKAWVEGSFTARELRETYRRYRTHLRPEDHLARLDRLVWANHARAARRMYRYVDEGQQRLAEARLTLRAYAGGVDRAIARVPQSLHDDPGLVYERLRWRRKKGRDEDARALLRHVRRRTSAPGPSSGGGNAPFWREALWRTGWSMRPMRSPPSTARPRPRPIPKPSGSPGGSRFASSTMRAVHFSTSSVCTAR